MRAGSGLDEHKRAHLKALRAALWTLEEGAPPALEALLPGIVELLGSEKATAFELTVDSDDRVSLIHSASVGVPKGPLAARLQGLLHAQSRAFAAWDPVVPQAHHRNRAIISVGELGREGYEALPVYRAYRPVIGELDTLRALLCDGPSALACVSVFQATPFEDRQRDLLQALIPSLRARALLERRLGEGGFVQARVGAALDALGAPALIMSAGGRVLHANAPARAALAREGGLQERLAAALARLDDPRFTITKLEQRGARAEYLLVGRPVEMDASARAFALAKRFGLDAEGAELLTLIARGLTDAEIVAHLDRPGREVARDVEALLGRIDCGDRATLFARLWSDAPGVEPSAAPAATPPRVTADVKRVATRAGLTGRQAQILKVLAEGLTNRGIAASLTISARTVESHLEAIYDKLGVCSRAAALALVLEASPRAL